MRGDTRNRTRVSQYYANLPPGVMMQVFPLTPAEMDIFEMSQICFSTSGKRGTVGHTPYEFGLVPYIFLLHLLQISGFF